MLFTAGLALVVLGWLAQLIKIIVSGKRHLSGVMLVPYGLGCTLLAVGGFLAGDWVGASLNTACVLIPLAIMVIIIRE
jgi:hypothetical protein